jgi:hypothetical protein
VDIDTLRAAQNGRQMLAEHLATMTLSAVNFETGSVADLKRLGQPSQSPTGAAAYDSRATGLVDGYLRQIDILPAMNDRDSYRAAHPAPWWVLASQAAAGTSPPLMPPPRALRVSASPAATMRPSTRMFLAAFRSRSWVMPHSVQVHVIAMSEVAAGVLDREALGRNQTQGSIWVVEDQGRKSAGNRPAGLRAGSL